MGPRIYKEHTITLDERWRFAIAGPTVDPTARGETFPSMVDAEIAIDARIVARAKQKKAEEKPVHVLDEDGEAATVRGIHSGQGHLLGVEGSWVFPVHPTLRQKLTRRAALHKELAAIRDEVQPFGVRTRRAYGHVRPEAYEAEMAKFAAELADRAEKAKAL
jgi:hypothetical protein